MNDRTVLFQGVGDIALGDHPLCAGFGTHSRHRKRAPSFPFEHVTKHFDRAEVLFGNLECTLSQTGMKAGDYNSIQMRGHEAYLDGLTQAGFDVMNLANNHSLQHGRTPFRETVDILKGAGIEAAGVNNGDYRHCREVFVEKNGLKIGFLGYSLRPRQYFTEEPLYAEGERDRIVEDARRARAQCDTLVVSMHWGDEFIDRPSPDEIATAHAVMDAGADLIIGHHPHVLRGVEKYGRGYIVYSLGNFVCDMIWDSPLRETAIVQCRLTAEGVRDFELLPVRINDDYQPQVLAGEAGKALLARIGALSDRLQHLCANPAEVETMEQYNVAAHEEHAKSRAKSHRYFLRNAYKFPPALVVQQLRTYVRNRLAERGFIKQPPPMPGC